MLNLKNQKNTKSTDNNAKKVQPCSNKDHPQRHANPIAKKYYKKHLSHLVYTSLSCSTHSTKKRDK